MRKRWHLCKLCGLKVKHSAHLGPRTEISYPHKCGGILKNQLSGFSWATRDAIIFLLTQNDYSLPLVPTESFSLIEDEVKITVISSAMRQDTKPVKKRGREIV